MGFLAGTNAIDKKWSIVGNWHDGQHQNASEDKYSKLTS
jgi:hypothetical protein